MERTNDSSCGPCERNFEEKVNELVETVEDYTPNDRMKRHEEVEEAFSSGEKR